MSRDDQVSILRSKFIVRLQNMNMVPVRGQKSKDGAGQRVQEPLHLRIYLLIY